MAKLKQKHNAALGKWKVMAREGGQCAKCGIKTDYLTVDHIVPAFLVEMLDETGTAVYDDEENFELVCPPCNKNKGNMVNKRDPRVVRLLQKYLSTGSRHNENL